MPDSRTEELLNLIGSLLAEDSEYPLDGTLLHAAVARASVAPSIFKDLGNHILYRDPDLDRLGDALLELWGAQQGEDRWAEIEYLVRDGRFDANFVYPEDINQAEEPLDRRRRIVAHYFGEKPIVYPDPEDESPDEFKL